MDARAPTSDWHVEVFFDGDCPLCLREIKLFRWLDRKQRIRFTDIAAPNFRSTEFGKNQADFMDEIHGRLPDENGNPGRWIMGIEVFRRLYAAVGFGLLVAATRLPGVSHVLDFGYRIFAKHRLRLTGRCTKDTCGAGRSSANW